MLSYTDFLIDIIVFYFKYQHFRNINVNFRYKNPKYYFNLFFRTGFVLNKLVVNLKHIFNTRKNFRNKKLPTTLKIPW